jgi:hypothetical protein
MKKSKIAALILSEADWLDEAANNASPSENQDFIRGFRTAARWVRFHGDHPFLLEGRARLNGKENEGTTPAGEISSVIGTSSPDSSK